MTTLSAGELMRGAGLLVDGPVRWNGPVGGREPGIFVVELAEPVAEPPIDIVAVRRWLERAKALTVDGERPTTRQLANRLGDFWPPDQQVVYVGRARRAVGARVAALYATPLGDDRPNANGHWLKTLLVLGQARIWWSTTDAHEEYEDALLEAFIAAAGQLPFANLTDSSGTPKSHGIENSLVEPVAPAGAKPSGKQVSQQPESGLIKRRRLPAPKDKPAPPPAAPSMVSASGAAELQTELDNLRNKVRPAVIQRVKLARELGDLRENSEYQEARREQSFVEGRIQALEALLRTAVVVEASADGAIAVGSKVVVEIDGESNSWQLVGSNEADPSNGRISYMSPVGQALMGRRQGEEVTARLPRGELRLRVVKVG